MRTVKIFKYKSIVILLLIFIQLNAYPTVKGPLIIDIIGYDSIAGIIYFAQTDWAECDCETDLYKYHVTDDSLEILSMWAERLYFSKNKDKIISEKGLNHLSKINFSAKESVSKFIWLPKVAFYSPVMMKNMENCPFLIAIADKKFSYTQCFSQNPEPIIKEFRLNSKSGIILLKYHGDCYEGNTVDRLIFYQQVENVIQSRELKLEDKLSVN